MESQRLKKVNSVLQKDLGQLLDAFTRDHFRGTLMSVSEVRVAPDLSYAKVFVSVFPSDRQVAAMELLEKSKGQIRYELGTRVRNQLRVVPDLDFRLDPTLDKRDEVDQLLKGKGDNPFK
jgi:ribosome-binding factor A